MPSSNEALFSRDPSERLTAARAVASAEAQSVPPLLEDLPVCFRALAERIRDAGDIMAPLNAWMLFVGPSYGGEIDPTVLSRYSGHQVPTLGRRHPNSTWAGLSHKTLRTWAVEAFRRNNIFETEDDAWSVTGLMNLCPAMSGDASKVSDDSLRAGRPKLHAALDVMRPRVVIALSKPTYETISNSDWLQSIGASPEAEQKHKVPGKNQMFQPRSIWISWNDGRPQTLIAAAPMHPAKWNFQVPEETYSYLGNIVQRGVCAST